MWGCHGNLISPPHLPTSPPPPAWLQTGRRKIKRGKKDFGGSDNDRGGKGGEDKEKRRRRRRCVWLLGEQLVSRLANINIFVLEFGVFCAVGGIFYLICQGLFVSLFPLISVINVPFIGSE